jgi:hypothetical protein
MPLYTRELTDEKKLWLANLIRDNKKKPPNERLTRDQIYRAVNKQFPGTKFTLSRLLHLYTGSGGQSAFVEKTIAAIKPVALASIKPPPAPQREQRKEEPVPAIPKSAPAKKLKAAALPKAKPATVREKPVPVVEEAVQAPRIAAAPRTAKYADDQFAATPRAKAKSLTAEDDDVIAEAFMLWTNTEPKLRFGRVPAACAAMFLNRHRKTVDAPIVHANVVQDRIGDTANLKDYLLRTKTFGRLSRPHEAADRVASAVPRFVDVEELAVLK